MLTSGMAIKLYKGVVIVLKNNFNNAKPIK